MATETNAAIHIVHAASLLDVLSTDLHSLLTQAFLTTSQDAIEAPRYFTTEDAFIEVAVSEIISKSRRDFIHKKNNAS